MRTYNLFISHSWAYSDKYEKLERLLKQRSYFAFKNYSIPKNDPLHTSGTDKELFEAILRKMQPCSVALILAGVYATYSKWIQKEIQIAQKKFTTPKPIIAIEHWGSKKTSQIVKSNASRIVKWNTESIVSAIRELA